MGLITSLLGVLYAVVPMLGILIFVHELGHFLVAKLCGVRVLKFSLGFGPPIGFGNFRARWERHGTEYVIAWFPLGGFVKMLGENLAVQGQDPEPEAIDAAPEEYLSAKPTWQKLSIVFAGPVMNLLLPVLAFVGILAVGIPRLAAVVGNVEPQSPAARAGIEVGDTILSVNGRDALYWEEFERAIRRNTSGELTLRLRRGEQERELSVPLVERTGLDEFGVVGNVGWIGVESHRLPALVGVLSLSSPAGRAGLRSGDRITHLGDAEVEGWVALRQLYLAAGPGPVAIQLQRGEEEPPIDLRLPALGSLERLGVVPATILVQSVSEELPAKRAGLQAGDLIIAVDGRPAGSFLSFRETVRASRGRALAITYAREGVTHTVSIQPEERLAPGPLGIEERNYLIGITHAPVMLRGEVRIERERNPILALPRAAALTLDMSIQFLRGLTKLVKGEIGRDKLAGPIGIAEIARRSLDLGWRVYLYTMILISINLAILNLLPIPILDGGQALLFAIEGIKRSPISLRTREVVQQIGFTMILMLMGLAFWNDLSRHWEKLVDWLRGTGL